MDKQIPIYFDTIIADSPIQEIPYEDSNAFRLKVGVFTKYRNRNGSYITNEFAESLIDSATKGNTPVVGFFDPETQTWASHTGPTLANGYGYVESFLGWEPLTDTDGQTRDYAIFSVVIFTDYYEEAKKIRGQHQSMELNPETITGEWMDFDGEDYFVYKTGKMLGFCVIGAHEPCFSVSTFFSKNDDTYKSQYEKFSSLLSNLKTRVEEAEKIDQGGEQPMNEFENQEVVEETQMVEEPQTVETAEFAAEAEAEVEATEEAEVVETEAEESVEEAEAEFEAQESEEEVVTESEPETANEFEVLQQQFDELKQSFDTLKAEYENYQNTTSEELNTLRATNAQLQESISKYEVAEKTLENSRKQELINKYEKVMSAEEIKPITDMVNDFSYDELESKLAIAFANDKIAGGEVKKVPLPEPQESQFALLMSKYRK